MDIQLSVGMASNPRTWAIHDGRVKPDGIQLVPSPVHPSELFWRQLKFGDFDVSEMSFSSLIMAMAAGDERWVGLPVFTTRRFFHTGVLIRKDAGIQSPADLKGKRVGVAGVPADCGPLDPRRPPARVRRRAQGHGVLHGARPRAEPRRRHRLQAP